MTYRARHDVAAVELTTLQVGGVCSLVLDTSTSDGMVRALAEHPDAICVGGGSNLLISDAGIRTPLLRGYAKDSAELHIDARTGLVNVGAAVDWDVLVQRTVAAGLSGLESTSGIPGSTGGALVQNAGAYGQEICESVVSVTVFDRELVQVQTLEPQDVQFGYRSTRFKHDSQRRFVVLSVQLTLDVDAENAPRYGDVSAILSERFGDRDRYAIGDVRDAVLEVRRSKGMLVGASAPSAGSFFTNPEVDRDAFDLIASMEGVKELVRTGDSVRVSAAALINGAGYERGDTFGNAGLSPFHVLALVNNGEASATEVVDLANRIRSDVFEKYGVELRPEPVTLGFDENPFPALR